MASKIRRSQKHLQAVCATQLYLRVKCNVYFVPLHFFRIWGTNDVIVKRRFIVKSFLSFHATKLDRECVWATCFLPRGQCISPASTCIVFVC